MSFNPCLALKKRKHAEFKLLERRNSAAAGVTFSIRPRTVIICDVGRFNESCRSIWKKGLEALRGLVPGSKNCNHTIELLTLETNESNCLPKWNLCNCHRCMPKEGNIARRRGSATLLDWSVIGAGPRGSGTIWHNDDLRGRMASRCQERLLDLVGGVVGFRR